MEYAVIELGGSQVKVKKGDVINADIVLSDSKKTLKLGKVIMRHLGKKVEIGDPHIKGANISCDVLGAGKTKKVTAYKYKRRKSSKFKKGHRQNFITLKVKEIT